MLFSKTSVDIYTNNQCVKESSSSRVERSVLEAKCFNFLVPSLRMRRAKDFVSWSGKTSAVNLLLFKFNLANKICNTQACSFTALHMQLRLQKGMSRYKFHVMTPRKLLLHTMTMMKIVLATENSSIGHSAQTLQSTY